MCVWEGRGEYEFVELYLVGVIFFLMIRRPPRSTRGISSAASDVYKRQPETCAVKLDGKHATVEPLETVTLNQLYFFS